MQNRYNIQHSSLGAIWGLGAPLIITIVASIIAAIAGEESGLANSTAFLVVTSVLTELSFFFVMWLISYKRNVDFASATGAKTTSPWYFYLIVALLGVVCVFLFLPIISLWEDLLSLIGYNISDSLSMPFDTAGWFILAIFTTALIPAICEEFLFRGLVLNGLRKYGAFTAIGFSALMFSLMHMNLQQLPYTIILGVVFGLIVYYTRNIWLSIIMHFCNNLTALFIMYFFRDSGAPFVWWEIIIALVCVLGAALLIYFVIWFFRRQNGYKGALFNFKKKKVKENANLSEVSSEVEVTQSDLIENDPQDTQEILPKPVRNRLLITPIIVGVVFLILFSLISFGVI